VAELRVRLTPRAGRDALTGLRDGVVQARVAAPPVDAKANDALCRLLAKALGVAPSRVAVVKGQAARQKTVRVDGLGDAEARERLALAAE
jgi:hypothetical protein